MPRQHISCSISPEPATVTTIATVLFCGRRRRRLEPAAIEHGVVALLTLLEAHRGAEHVSSTLRLLEFMHPPIRHLTRATGILDAGPIGPVYDRNALHLVPILLGIRPGDANCELRSLVIQRNGLRQIFRVSAVREGGNVFRPAGADHDRRAIVPVDAIRQGSPMGLAAGLDGDCRPSRRGLKRYALAADAVVGGAGMQLL